MGVVAAVVGVVAVSVWGLFVAGWLLVVALVASTFALAVWGIWTSDMRGMVAWVTLVASVPLGALMGFWSDEHPPSRPLPRSARKRLRDERNRIALDAEIARMEREAGIR